MSALTVLARGLPVLFVAWILVGSVLWASSGAGTPAVLATTASLVALGAAAWHCASRPHRPRWRGLALAFDVLLATVFAFVLIVVGYGVEALATSRSVADVIETSRFFPFEVFLWMWLYALLAAGGRGARLRRDLEAARRSAAEARAAATEARLEALQGQLNPHFLFNTLHGLATLVRRDPEAAEAAIERLGDLLRYALDGGAAGRVPLRDEVRFTRDYIALAEMARGDRMQARLEVDDGDGPAMVPPFALQTLVENAIRHGVDTRPDGGHVRIRVVVDGDVLQLIVEDEGRGGGSVDGVGVGLENLRSRLAALYGDRGGVRLEALPGGGTRATLTAPVS